MPPRQLALSKLFRWHPVKHTRTWSLDLARPAGGSRQPARGLHSHPVVLDAADPSGKTNQSVATFAQDFCHPRCSPSPRGSPPHLSGNVVLRGSPHHLSGARSRRLSNLSLVTEANRKCGPSRLSSPPVRSQIPAIPQYPWMEPDPGGYPIYHW